MLGSLIKACVVLLLAVSNMYIQSVCPILISIYSPDADADADASGLCSCCVVIPGCHWGSRGATLEFECCREGGHHPVRLKPQGNCPIRQYPKERGS